MEYPARESRTSHSPASTEGTPLITTLRSQFEVWCFNCKSGGPLEIESNAPHALRIDAMTLVTSRQSNNESNKLKKMNVMYANVDINAADGEDDR
jgi:hypothetical protein